MPDLRLPEAARAHGERRHALAPEPAGALSVAHLTPCPWRSEGHGTAARRAGATSELMEAIWVAVEMRAGAAFAHSVKALELIEE